MPRWWQIGIAQVLSDRVESDVGEETIRGSRSRGTSDQSLTTLTVFHQTSTNWGRTRGHHRGRKNGQPRISPGKQSSWGFRTRPPLSAAFVDDSVGYGRRVSAGLAGSDHGGYEVEDYGAWLEDDDAVDDQSRRRPTF